MAQPTPGETNGAVTLVGDENGHLTTPGKRKRDSEKMDAVDEEMTDVPEYKPTAPHPWPAGKQKDLIKNYYDVLSR